MYQIGVSDLSELSELSELLASTNTVLQRNTNLRASLTISAVKRSLHYTNIFIGVLLNFLQVIVHSGRGSHAQECEEISEETTTVNSRQQQQGERQQQRERLSDMIQIF